MLGLCLCVSARVGDAAEVAVEVSLWAAVEVWPLQVPPSLPGQIYSQHRAGSQLALSSPPLMSMADPRQTPLGAGV